MSKTVYYGWDNVPVNTLVKTRSKDYHGDEDSREFFYKGPYYHQGLVVRDRGGFLCDQTYNPDDYTTGRYVEVR